MTIIYKPIGLIEALGEAARVPSTGILDFGGTAGPTFSVGGKGLLFDDGTSTLTGHQIIVPSVVSPFGYEFVQGVEATTWTIAHNKDTDRINITIWDEVNEVMLPDSIRQIDDNTIVVTFNTAVKGRAILILFPKSQ